MKEQDMFSRETILAKRRFPIGGLIGLIFLILLQAGAILFAALYQPSPQDYLQEYRIVAEPQENGDLKLTYSFVWEALDSTEPLTWVEIGMANSAFVIDDDSLSDTIFDAYKDVDGDYVYTHIVFASEYRGGETVEFSFSVMQSNLLSCAGGEYFYDFVPGWFNKMQVGHYDFRFLAKNGTSDAAVESGYFRWTGSLDYGEQKHLYVIYPESDFEAGITPAPYSPHIEKGANELDDDQAAVWVFMCMLVFFLGIAEVSIVDSFVSYTRGRGFMRGYGHYVHHYGYINPRYAKARDAHASSSGGSHGGGHSCACACACACAGGGRAGCSQKDTVDFSKKQTKLS